MSDVEQIDLPGFVDVMEQEVLQRLADVAMPMTDVVLISRSHEGDARYAIKVHGAVLRAYDYFERMLSGGYAESASHTSDLRAADDLKSSTAPSGKRKLPAEFDVPEASGPAAARMEGDECLEPQELAAGAQTLESRSSCAEGAQQSTSAVGDMSARHAGTPEASASPAAESSTSSAAPQPKQIIIRMGISHAILLRIVRWMYTQLEPEMDDMELADVIEFYASAQMLGMAKLEEDLLAVAFEYNPFSWDMLREGVLCEEVGRHPRLKDLFCHHITYWTVHQGYEPDEDVDNMVQRLLDSNDHDSGYAAEVRKRFAVFLCRGPRLLWSADGADNPDLRKAAQTWWRDSSAELLLACVPVQPKRGKLMSKLVPTPAPEEQEKKQDTPSAP